MDWNKLFRKSSKKRAEVFEYGSMNVGESAKDVEWC